MSRRMTMAQVANDIGVSRNVVSAVINNRSQKLHISEKTKKKIEDYLEKSGYVKSKHAMRLLDTQASDSLNILTCGPFALYPHLVRALHVMSETIKKKYCHVDIISIDANNIQHGLREIVSQGTTRMIWMHATAPEYEMANAKKLMPLLKRMERVVVYNYDFNRDEWEQEYLNNGIHLVGVDRAACYRKVAEIFTLSGHRKVAFDEIFSDHPVHKGPNIEKLIAPFIHSEFEVFGLRDFDDPDSAEKMAVRLFELHKKCGVDCAFIRNDPRAGEIMGRLQAFGLKVPDDIAIIGFGNHPLSNWLKPSLSTFDFPVAEMCEKTMYLLSAENIDGAECSYFDNKLILRDSHNPK